MTLNALEKAVLEATNRENMNAGFFTIMRPSNTKTRISQPPVIGNIFAKIRGMRNPMTFVLFVKDGLIDTLEGASMTRVPQISIFP